MIKKATLFKTGLHASSVDFDDCISDEFTVQYPTELQRLTYGFTPVHENDYVRKFGRGYQFNVMIWEKKLDNQIVNRLTKKRCEELQLFDKKSEQGIKDNVINELIKTTHPKCKVIRCFYHSIEGMLIIETTSNAESDIVMKLLIDCIGSIKTQTLHVSHMNGITEKLNQRISLLSEEAWTHYLFDVMELNGLLELKNRENEVVSFKGVSWNEFDEHTLVDIQSHIERMFTVNKVRLSTEYIEFTLDSNFKFSQIKYPAFEPDETCEDIAQLEVNEIFYDVCNIVYSALVIVNEFTEVEDNG